MIGKNIYGMELFENIFNNLRHIVPSILNDCPSLRFVSFHDADNFLIEFPCDDSAKASDGRALAKWLFTPHPNNVPKVLRCFLYTEDGNLASKIEALKAAFVNSSSPANFIVDICFLYSFADYVVLFDLTNIDS
ncbi:hypothetical protein niasHT_032175 [Heterodera trifolii]|uniref:Uncharacterized protein n=1 Tax=Heterodera trifolii TaxID=157864 RepID=A0ABD2HY38_9BILA